MTRGIFIEQIRRQLAGGNVPTNFAITPQEVGKKVDQVANDAIKIMCLQGMAADYVTTYENVKVQFDSNKNQYYCELPNKVISLPSQSGVYQVSTMKDQSKLILACSPSVEFLYSSDINAILQGNVGYYNQQNKLYLVNYESLTDTDTLLLKLVVDRSVFDDEEDYQVPPDMEALILMKTLELFQGK